ncbi:MAG: cation diffusion facilitator family transporter [Acidimicrobiales bacterium]
MPVRRSLTPFAWLSIAAALVTMGMKAAAYLLTGSVGLLSDAVESSVNLVAALVALVALRVAARPPDEEHAYGHAKAEYFSAAIEGAMILVAAGSIVYAAIDRLLHPVQLEQLGIGLVVSVVAAFVNLAVALVLLRVGTRHRSITLEADGRHLLTDVWTSAGVVVAVGAVAMTGWELLDPIIAIAVATNIVVAGWALVRRSALGLMDVAVPAEQRAAIERVLASHSGPSVQFHALRTRQAGPRSFVSFHLLVPRSWTVQEAHDLAERVEADLHAVIPGLTVEVHIEPLEDPRSFADEDLDRLPVPPSARPGADTPSSTRH